VARLLYFSKTVLKILIPITVSIVFAFQPVEAKKAKSQEIGIVATKRLNVRPLPGVTRPPLKVIERGTKVQVLEHVNGWVKIKHNGQIGYIRNLKRYLRIISISTVTDKTTGDFDDNIKQFKQDAENINQEIEKGKKEVLTFTRKEAAIVSSLNDIDRTLDKARTHAKAIKYELSTLEKKIEATKNMSLNLKKRIKANENYASRRLVALYKLNWMGTIHVLVSAESVYDLFQRKNKLERILDYDEKIRQNLLDNKKELHNLLTRLNEQKMEKLSLESDFKKQIALMSKKKAQRSRLLDDIRGKRSLEMAALEILKQAAADLDRAIKSINLEAYSIQTKKKLPKSFTSLKGLLNMPVKGKIISFFGPYKNKKFNVLNFQSGIKIKTDRGEPVRAVCDGHILYASWFKGYGNMIIIDHGDNYYTVYAHAEELFASKGDTVETGQVVATVGDSGSMIGPNLHFEIRHHGKPMDPLKWFKKG
jgi:septal ring factor EnvC (AmiA/AmiB activator)